MLRGGASWWQGMLYAGDEMVRERQKCHTLEWNRWFSWGRLVTSQTWFFPSISPFTPSFLRLFI